MSQFLETASLFLFCFFQRWGWGEEWVKLGHNPNFLVFPHIHHPSLLLYSVFFIFEVHCRELYREKKGKIRECFELDNIHFCRRGDGGLEESGKLHRSVACCSGLGPDSHNAL